MAASVWLLTTTALIKIIEKGNQWGGEDFATGVHVTLCKRFCYIPCGYVLPYIKWRRVDSIQLVLEGGDVIGYDDIGV